jgi:transcriptional regulator with XRE-family HTH domain
MTPAQCRAARALLDITQSQLAYRADLGLSTVVDFEKERRQVSDEAVKAIRAALERAGIEFMDENGGRGLRLRKPGKHKS